MRARKANGNSTKRAEGPMGIRRAGSGRSDCEVCRLFRRNATVDEAMLQYSVRLHDLMLMLCREMAGTKQLSWHAKLVDAYFNGGTPRTMCVQRRSMLPRIRTRRGRSKSHQRIGKMCGKFRGRDRGEGNEES